MARSNTLQGDFTLPVHIDVRFVVDALADDALLRNVVADSTRLLVVLDANVAKAHPTLADALHTWAANHTPQLTLAAILEIPGGEAAKQGWDSVLAIGEAIRQHQVCKHSIVLAIGGGAVLDVAGFAAAIAHRGVRHVRMPTTVLSMNDSGIGIKNGINAFGTKNFFGTFAPPDLVVCDTSFLATLDDKTWCSGLSEAFKVGAIKDAAFLHWLCDNVDALRTREAAAESYMIQRAAQLHLEHICSSGDPFEKGSARPLDFGHWAAHRLETLTGHALLHGEAVAIGIALDLRYAAAIHLIAESEARHIISAMRAVGLPTAHPLLAENFDAVWLGLAEFQEHLGGVLSIAMPSPLGCATSIHEVDRERMRALAESAE